MNTDEMLKYLGCAVLLVVLIYFIGVILKVNNDFIGSVLGGKFREGLSNKEDITKKIENQIASNEKSIKSFNDMGADFTENKDLLTKLNASYMELIMKANMVQMILGNGAWSFKATDGEGGWKNLTNIKPQEELAYLTVLNEVQEYIDGGGGATTNAKKGYFS